MFICESEWKILKTKTNNLNDTISPEPVRPFQRFGRRSITTVPIPEFESALKSVRTLNLLKHHFHEKFFDFEAQHSRRGSAARTRQGFSGF